MSTYNCISYLSIVLEILAKFFTGLLFGAPGILKGKGSDHLQVNEDCTTVYSSLMRIRT